MAARVTFHIRVSPFWIKLRAFQNEHPLNPSQTPCFVGVREGILALRKGTLSERPSPGGSVARDGMTKDRIIAEIRRTAAENGGVPWGQRRFQSEAGIS